MRSFMLGLAVVAVTVLGAGHAAAQGVVEEVAKGCETELETHCAGVTVGNGRVLACLYAYSDKLSGRCEYALYDAAAQLERAISALTYVANECDADITKHCAAVELGEGRLAQCLGSSEVSKRCSAALTDTGLK